jgi:hypothetical protein
LCSYFCSALSGGVFRFQRGFFGSAFRSRFGLKLIWPVEMTSAPAFPCKAVAFPADWFLLSPPV